jgi:hypothetical protein
MDKRLENLRMFFPAEVTGAYLAIQSLLKANKVLPTEYTLFMLCMVAGLAVINTAMYWKFYNVKSFFLHLILLCGFLIWAINIDMPRFKDVPYLGAHLEIVAPSLLIFYSLLTLFIAAPQRTPDAPNN